jgi:hypothetical protein
VAYQALGRLPVVNVDILRINYAFISFSSSDCRPEPIRRPQSDLVPAHLEVVPPCTFARPNYETPK